MSARSLIARPMMMINANIFEIRLIKSTLFVSKFFKYFDLILKQILNTQLVLKF
jgi:hypothetical protein